MASLIGKNAEVEGRTFPLVDEHTYIGRHEDNDISVHDVSVSHQHCLIFKLPDQLSVQDQDSTNGVRINGKEVEEALLHHGDELAVGDLLFTVDAPEHPADEDAIEYEEEEPVYDDDYEEQDDAELEEASEPDDMISTNPEYDEDITVFQQLDQIVLPKTPKQKTPITVPPALYKVSYVVALLIFVLLVVLYIGKVMGS